MKIYLAGPIDGCTDHQARGWREKVKALFPNCLDPMRRDYRDRTKFEAGEIVNADKRDIEECDVVLVWYPRPSVGTAMEIIFAWWHGKTVIVIDRSRKPLSPWIICHASLVFTTLEEFVVWAVKNGHKFK